LGHNNDSGIFNYSELKSYLIENGLKVLVDGGYGSESTLKNNDVSEEDKSLHHGFRSC
jgi:hypothetical protein